MSDPATLAYTKRVQELEAQLAALELANIKLQILHLSAELRGMAALGELVNFKAPILEAQLNQAKKHFAAKQPKENP